LPVSSKKIKIKMARLCFLSKQTWHFFAQRKLLLRYRRLQHEIDVNIYLAMKLVKIAVTPLNSGVLPIYFGFHSVDIKGFFGQVFNQSVIQNPYFSHYSPVELRKKYVITICP